MHSSRASSTKTRIETRAAMGEDPYTPEHQEQVPRKQGLKLPCKSSAQASMAHQEQVPRKQGLKPLDTITVAGAPLSSRASSTKTRIETLHSRTTDIWTRHQEQVPRKQGLKRRYFYASCILAGLIKSKFHENKD